MPNLITSAQLDPTTVSIRSAVKDSEIVKIKMTREQAEGYDFVEGVTYLIAPWRLWILAGLLCVCGGMVVGSLFVG